MQHGSWWLPLPMKFLLRKDHRWSCFWILFNHFKILSTCLSGVSVDPEFCMRGAAFFATRWVEFIITNMSWYTLILYLLFHIMHLNHDATFCFISLKENPKTGENLDASIRCLGSTIGIYTLPSTGTQCWFMSSDEYVREAMQNVESELTKTDLKLKSKVDTSSSPSDCPEFDVSDSLSDGHACTAPSNLLVMNNISTWFWTHSHTVLANSVSPCGWPSRVINKRNWPPSNLLVMNNISTWFWTHSHTVLANSLSPCGWPSRVINNRNWHSLFQSSPS